MQNDNNKICNGYESNFTFLSDEDFQKHLETCENCAKEHSQLKKVSELLKEVKPYYKENRRRKNALKAACAVFVVFISASCASLFVSTGGYDDFIAAHQPTASELGLPVDEYGFIMVD